MGKCVTGVRDFKCLKARLVGFSSTAKGDEFPDASARSKVTFCSMKFSEANDPWRSVPEWASFLIEFGFAWLAPTLASRRIAVISMPSDSAAAGLIALGAMRKCLELDDANDMNVHYEKLLNLARKRPSGVTVRNTKMSGVFVFDGVGNDGNPWVKKLSSRSLRAPILRSTAINWRIHGEAPVAPEPSRPDTRHSHCRKRQTSGSRWRRARHTRQDADPDRHRPKARAAQSR